MNKKNNHDPQFNQSKTNKKCYRHRPLQQVRAKLRQQTRRFDRNNSMKKKKTRKRNKQMFNKKLSIKPDNNLAIIQPPLVTHQKIIMKKSNALNMTNPVSQQMLLAMTDDKNNFLVQSLDTTEKFHYLRQYAQLIHNLYCLKYEQDLWQTYYQISIIANIWSTTTTTTTITKEVALENHLPRYLFTTRVNVEKRQKKLIDQLMKTEHDLNNFRLQRLSVNGEFMDWNVLFRLVRACIGDELAPVRNKYERQKVLFQYDANDYRFVKLFYDLQPTEEQIRSTKLIWQATDSQLKIKEQLFLLKKDLSFSLSSIDPIESLLMTSESRKPKTNCQLQYDRMIHSIRAAEETIENDKKLIIDEKNKMFNQLPLLSPASGTFAHLMDTLELRQNNMHERAQFLRQH